MAYDPISGQWRDDSTGLPDMGMPAGMGDFTGAPTRQPPPPQQINPRPIPGAAPQAGYTPAPQAPAMLTDPSKAGVAAQPISPPLTSAMVQGEWNKQVRPEMSGGDIAGAILKSPVTVPLGIVEELRGLLGGSTIEGWGNQAEARYNNPNFNESRAFGVPVAKEPEFGDRFLGVVSGRAQERAGAGIALRNEIGRYNKQRGAEISQFKDVIDIYKGATDLRRGQFQEDQDLKYTDLKNRLGIQTSQLGLKNTQQEMQKREVEIAKLQVELGITREQAESLVQQNQLYNTPGTQGGFPARGLTGPAANVPGLLPSTVEAARKAEADRSARDAAATALQRAQPVNPLQQTGPEVATAAAAKIQDDLAAAERQRKAKDDEINATIRDVDQAFEARKHTDITKPGLFDFGMKSIPDQIKDLDNQAAQLKADVAAGKYIGKRGEAILAARGLPTAAPNATPMPGPTPTPGDLADRIGTMSPTDRTAEQLQREAQAAVAPAVPSLRPTPMATPRPPGTTNFVDLNKAPPEANRQADATKEARANEEFILNWVMHEGWNAPRTGPRFESMKAAFMAKKGL